MVIPSLSRLISTQECPGRAGTRKCSFVLGNTVPDRAQEHRAVFSRMSAWTTLEMIIQSFIYKSGEQVAGQ